MPRAIQPAFDELQDLVNDEAENDQQIVPIRYDITSYGADYDVDGIVRRLHKEEILIPPFQRSYVWTIKEASRFVESLLLGLPVPGVFFVKEPIANKFLVIDGQQRLKTLQFFYDGIFNPKEGEKNKQVFALTDVQKPFLGKTITALGEVDKVRLDNALIHVTIIKQDAPKDDDTSMYHIFDRLNSEGRRLTPQEIRTALYHGKFIDLIKDLNDVPEWRAIYRQPSTRLKDRELILRFLALYYSQNTYTKPMSEFLNLFCKRYRNPDPNFLAGAKSIFTNTIAMIEKSIGKAAFRLEAGLNAAVFDSIMVGLATRLDNSQEKPITSQQIKDAYDELTSKKAYLTLVSQSTADEKNVTKRLKMAIKAFQGN